MEAWGVEGDTTGLFAAQKPLLHLSIINIVKNGAFISDVPHPNACIKLVNGLGFGVKLLARAVSFIRTFKLKEDEEKMTLLA